ncbi:MAG: F0F1 ATP synthase subunit epsilon [Gemmatimonadales bacterium]|nr:MAG: F0F1 ATP synthase subunit epsilon [Gemmatimonadales bacterium]
MADSDRKLRVSVISPTAVGFSGEGGSVLIPAYDGQLGILVGHAPMMVLLGTGDVVVKDGDATQRIRVSGGFMQVIDDEVSVLAEQVEVESEVQPPG